MGYEGQATIHDDSSRKKRGYKAQGVTISVSERKRASNCGCFCRLCGRDPLLHVLFVQFSRLASRSCKSTFLTSPQRFFCELFIRLSDRVGLEVHFLRYIYISVMDTNFVELEQLWLDLVFLVVLIAPALLGTFRFFLSLDGKNL